MKKTIIIALFILSTGLVKAQKIFSVDAEYKANVKVFVVDAE
jgi:hypothetical protein